MRNACIRFLCLGNQTPAISSCRMSESVVELIRLSGVSLGVRALFPYAYVASDKSLV
jgi:hypothetical protein